MIPLETALFGRVDRTQATTDFHVHRHGVLAGNLANADTPNYRPEDVIFRETLAGCALAETRAGHLAGAPVERWQRRRPRAEAHHDGSGVEVELTQSQIAANRVRFEESVAIMKFELSQLRLAAANGK